MARTLSQLRHEVWVRQVAHVEHQIHVARVAELEAETYYLNAHGCGVFVGAKTFDQVTAKGVNRTLRGVNDVVCVRANPLHRLSLGAYGRGQAVAHVRGMRAASLTEAPL